MTNIKLINYDNADGPIRQILDSVQAHFGRIGNTFRAAANSGAALKMLWTGYESLAYAHISARLGEQIALAVAHRHGCEYCLAAHTMLGRRAGLTEVEISQAKVGKSDNEKAAAALCFVLKVIDVRGQTEVAPSVWTGWRPQ